jgi:sporulation protein YlmC with PRC-barrel domain
MKFEGKEVIKMKKRFFSVTIVLAFLGLGFIAGCQQPSSVAQREFPGYQASELMGLSVKDRDGVPLGQISDLVLDCNGRIDFTIVNQPGSDQFPARRVLVPFRSLMISREEPDTIRVVFNTEREKFHEGPEWDRENLADMNKIYSVYGHYGLAPAWSDRPLQACY